MSLSRSCSGRLARQVPLAALLVIAACDSPAAPPSDAGSKADAKADVGSAGGGNGGRGTAGAAAGGGGNTAGSGGVAGSGGALGTGGRTSTGGGPASGGRAGTGGGSASGGSTGTGGLSTGSGGRGGSGGIGTASGGSGTASGGSGTASGGANGGAGGKAGAGGAAGAGGGAAGAGGMLLARLNSAVTSYDFGDVEVGVATAAYTWTISNMGPVPSGALSLTNDAATEMTVTTGCTASLAVGAMCSIAATFKAAQAGTRTAVLTLTGGAAAPITLRLSARGLYRVTVMTTGTGAVTFQPGDIPCGTGCSMLMDPGWIRLRASTTNGSGSFFAGWSVDACKGPARECALALVGSQAITARFLPLTSNLIFMTAANFPANLGGATAYDSRCNQVATAAGINDTAGTAYIAMMSDTASLAKDRLGTARGWVRLDGAPFADTQSSLFSDGRVFNSVRFDETGARLAAREAFTGADPGGTLSIFNCTNWTSKGQGAGAADLAMFGSSDGGPGRWGTGSSGWCAQDRPLVCMGKTREAAMAPASQAGKKIWQAAGYTVGATTPDAHCLANLPAGVTAARAFLSSATQPASAALSPTAVYVRPDGTRVGTGTQLALGGGLDSGIWQLAGGAYSAGGVWTGSTQPGTAGTADTTCAGWTGQTGMGRTAWGSADETFWWNFGTSFCNEPVAIYCVEP